MFALVFEHVNLHVLQSLAIKRNIVTADSIRRNLNYVTRSITVLEVPPASDEAALHSRGHCNFGNKVLHMEQHTVVV